MKTLVFLNRTAGGGRAANTWRRLAPELADLLGVQPAVYDETCDWERTIEEASGSGPCLVTVAGGDGTVHRVANLVLALPPELRERTVLGALGFGSSNDFHKPTVPLRLPASPMRAHAEASGQAVRQAHGRPAGPGSRGPECAAANRGTGGRDFAAGDQGASGERRRAGGLSTPTGGAKAAAESSRFLGIPARCWPGRTVLQHVLEVSYLDPCGRRQVEYAVMSASIGMVALGNDLFNRRWGPVGACRALGTSAAVWSASLAGLWRQRGIPIDLSVDGRPAYGGTTCLLGFYVNQHIGGQLCYPAHQAAGGSGEPRMGVSLLADIDLARRLYLLGCAARKELPGPPQTLLWWARTATCTVHQPTLFELDGEVTQAQEVRVRLLPGVLRVCA